jgi:hypothetical protein
VTLGLEAVNRYETNVINTAADAMALLEDVGRANVCVHLDSYHMNIEEFSMHEAVQTCGNRLGCEPMPPLPSAPHSTRPSVPFDAFSCPSVPSRALRTFQDTHSRPSAPLSRRSSVAAPQLPGAPTLLLSCCHVLCTHRLPDRGWL